tara:strand:- start:6095 stop:8164 length:2070 start_codon:yes stop_codon:yes gene_type:complete
MKLPKAVRTGVQSLARENVSGILQTGMAKARAMQQVGSDMAAVHDDWRQNQNEAQERQARLEMSAAMADFESQYGGRDEYSPDEIPESISVRRMDRVVDENGVENEILRQSIPAHEVYPQMYREYVDKTASAISEMIEDEDLRGRWLDNANIAANDAYTSRVLNARKQQQAYFESQLNAQITTAISNKKYEAAEILAEDISDPEARAAMMASIRFQQESNEYNNLLLTEAQSDADLAEIEAAITELRDPDQPSALTGPQRVAMANQLEAVARQNELSLVAREERENAQIVSDAIIAIDSGDPRITEHTVQTLFDDGLVSGEQMTRMKLAIKDKQQEKLEQVGLQIQLDQIAASPHGIDPDNKDMRKAVDSRYQVMVESGVEPQQAATQTMRQFKVVPAAVQAQFRASNRADAQGLGSAAEMWIYAEDYAPQSLKDFDDNEVDVIRQVAANMRLGMNPSDAIEQVRRYEMMTPEQKAVLKQNASTMAESNAAALSERIGDYDGYDVPWSPFNPNIPAFMQSEFDAKTEKYLPQVGYNAKAAQNMAFTDITTKWRLTDINGDSTIMKNAPVGPKDVIRGEITRQYKAELSELNQLFPDMRVMGKHIRISSDQLTELQIEAGQKPTYLAYIITDEETGEMQVLKRFTWDSQKATKAHNDEILAKAAEERKARQARTQAKFDMLKGMHTGPKI